MYGGIWGGLVPLIVLILILFILSLGGSAGVRAFWTAGWMALFIGLFFARNKSVYCRTLLKGLGDANGIVIVTAWLFAGVFGKLMVAGGFVDGLVWIGFRTGATGSLFTLIAFLASMLFAMGTGTSTGTVLSLVPILYPAGVFLGSNPGILALGILSGAAFGDNLAPISDTTIVSAFTQEAEMQDVVRSRFPLAMTAALFTGLFIVAFGGGRSVGTLPELEARLDPLGLLMLISFLVVIVSALYGRHLIESLIYGNASAIVVGLVGGRFTPESIFHVPSVRGESTGIIQDGISNVTGAIVFALLMLAITQVLLDSGVLNRILKSFERRFVHSVKQAEFAIIIVTILASIPLSSNAAAELLVGPSLVKPIGKRFHLAPSRRANLMDCAVCTIFYTLPWDIAVVVWYGAVQAAAETFGIVTPPFTISLFNPYSWALLIVLIISILTGWNRKFQRENGSV